jgi:LysM repeat protein
MAKPMTASQLLAQLKKWGVKYKEVSGWQTRNRNSVGSWDNLNGFMWHHTGADTKDPAGYASGVLAKGITGLPGPLCHFGLAPDGTVYLIGWGRANHAGGGDPAVLTKVQNENYSGQLRPTKGNSNGVDGNRHFYGVEIMYSGSHKMTDAQYQSALKLSAAILDFHIARDNWGKEAKSVIAHGEWSSDKWDPGYASGKIMDMTKVRADVAKLLAAGPKGATPTTPTTPPTTNTGTHTVVKGDTLWGISQKYKVTVAELKSWNKLTSDELSIGQKLLVKAPAKEVTPVAVPKKTDIYKQVWDLDVATPPGDHATPENPTWAPITLLRGIYGKVERTEKTINEMKKTIDELKKRLDEQEGK